MRQDEEIKKKLQVHLSALDSPRNPSLHLQAHLLARQYLKAQLAKQTRTILEQPFTTQDHGQGLNLIGLPKKVPTYWLIAHYDTVDNSPGADDNGSAVAVALEVGAACPQIGLVFPDLEEAGLLGARHFVANDPYPQTRGFVLESVGYYSEEPNSQRYPSILPSGFPTAYSELSKRQFKGDFLALLYLENDQELASKFENLAQIPILSLALKKELLVNKAAQELADFGRSDHLAFWEQGRSCLMLTDSANFRNPNYHKASDESDSLDFSHMATLVKNLTAYFQ